MDEGNSVVVGQAMQDMNAGEVGRVRLGGPDLTQPRSPEWKRVRWSPMDLDRCEHGRHSIDSCFDCPNGPRNLFLLHPDHYPLTERCRTVDGRFEVRIGTMVRGEPIWVPAVHANRQETSE